MTNNDSCDKIASGMEIVPQELEILRCGEQNAHGFSVIECQSNLKTKEL